MSRNTSNGERPSARVSSGSRASNGTAGTSACSFSNSAIQRGGKRSTRVAITWPSLTNVGPELLQRHAHALRRVELDRLVASAAVQDLPGALEHAGDADALHEVAQAVPDEDRGDLVQPRQLAHDAEGLPQHRR